MKMQLSALLLLLFTVSALHTHAQDSALDDLTMTLREKPVETQINKLDLLKKDKKTLRKHVFNHRNKKHVNGLKPNKHKMKKRLMPKDIKARIQAISDPAVKAKKLQRLHKMKEKGALGKKRKIKMGENGLKARIDAIKDPSLREKKREHLDNKKEKGIMHKKNKINKMKAMTHDELKEKIKAIKDPVIRDKKLEWLDKKMKK